MILKAAYFAASGFADNRAIMRSDLTDAVTFGIASHVLWPKKGQLHNIRAWAETLVVRRGLAPGTAYDNPRFAMQVVSMGQRLERYWSESLRYHGNVAYPREVIRVRLAVEWLFVNSHRL